MIKIPGYTLHKKLGSGGMAVVYLATQNSLQREVALKVMRNVDIDGDAQNNSFGERFIHEGHDLASLVHPNIAVIHDISNTDEYNYYAMELLKAGSLDDKLKVGVSLEDAFNIILKIGSALDCAHRNNIVHRDLKPSNILFRDEVTPVLTDFGIAKNANRDTKLTRTGALLGTAWYMSPEQCRGQELDGRSDLYSLCILFYELITGNLPFDGEESIAVAMKQISDPIPLLPDNLSSLQPVINIALSKDPDDRFASVEDFCEVLQSKLVDEDSLQDSMRLHTKKFSSEDITDINDELDRITNSSPDQAATSSLMSSEEDFWEEEGRLRKWLLVTLLIVCMAYAYTYYDQRGYFHIQSAQAERDIPDLMRQAVRQTAAQQLSSPKGNNALESLKKVIAMDPQFKPALQMLEDIATTFELKAREQLKQKSYAKTVEFLEQGFQFSANHKGLSLVQKSFQEELKQNKINEKITPLLNRAEELLEQKKYIRPAENNVMIAINGILAIDQNHSQALTIKSQVKQVVLFRLRDMLQQKQYDKLQAELKLVLITFPQSQNIRDIELQLNEILNKNPD